VNPTGTAARVFELEGVKEQEMVLTKVALLRKLLSKTLSRVGGLF
jgi:hypothetical protein